MPETPPAAGTAFASGPHSPVQVQAWADQALAAFDQIVAASALRLRHRAGQRQMAACVASTLARAVLKGSGPHGPSSPTDGPGAAPAQDASVQDEATQVLAVIEAGTGVGKSLAYSAPAIALALARGARVLISTATVALQEQLIHKDLPALAASFEQPFRFVLAKGRGRYVCRLKLQRLGGAGDAADPVAPGDLLAFDDDDGGDATPPPDQAQRLHFYQDLAEALRGGAWDGERDSLRPPPDARWWHPVAAQARGCTGRHCPEFGACSYYERRRELVGAQVIVVNHDLLLASLGSGLLPAPDTCLLVLDEAHHLPAVALTHFASRMDISRTAWADALAQRVLKAAGELGIEGLADVPHLAAQLKQAMTDLARLVLDGYGAQLRADSPAPYADASGAAAFSGPRCVRLPGGRLPAPLQEPLQRLHVTSELWLVAIRSVAKALKDRLRDTPEQARHLSGLYASIGALTPQLQAVCATAFDLLTPGAALPGQKNQPQPGPPPPEQAPLAKWFTSDVQGQHLWLFAHTSPVLPGVALDEHLWRHTRAAVLTSATLTSCGDFDFFLRETGLWQRPGVTCLAVQSPFDYERQGRLTVAETRADPKSAAAFTAEMAQALVADLRQVRNGALALFTSREQLRSVTQALPAELRQRVLVQTEWPRQRLLALHLERVTAGQPSIIFGMQSFGEGLDLPGPLCEHLFIAKLPFASPGDPVGQARAEWLRQLGHDPFSDLVVPATALRLAQWMGRAIRTETDQAHVICYDRRLIRTRYGQRLLAGLPRLSQHVRAHGPPAKS